MRGVGRADAERWEARSRHPIRLLVHGSESVRGEGESDGAYPSSNNTHAIQ